MKKIESSQTGQRLERLRLIGMAFISQGGFGQPNSVSECRGKKNQEIEVIKMYAFFGAPKQLFLNDRQRRRVVFPSLNLSRGLGGGPIKEPQRQCNVAEDAG